MIFLHANTIFNTDTHAAEMLGVAILIRDVEAPVPQLSITGSLKAQGKTHGSTVTHIPALSGALLDCPGVS